MKKYIVKLSNLYLHKNKEFTIDNKFVFKNSSDDNEIIIEYTDEIPTSISNPRILRQALELSLPKCCISQRCNDEIQSVHWETRFLYSFYTDEIYKRDIPYELDDIAISKIENWYNKLKIYKNKENIKISPWNFAFNEYEESLKAVSIEISYVHLTTAIEALLVLGNNELIYRASLNTAMVCGENYEERKEIFDTVKKVYDIRSKTVHGDVEPLIKALKKDKEFSLFFRFREIVSNVLFITYDRDKKQVVDEVEKKILI